LCKKKLIVLNGDSFLANGINSLIKSINHNISSAIVCHHTEDASQYGSLIFNEENQLTSFSEKKKLGPGYVNSGIYYFSKETIIKYKNCGYMSLEYELIPNMILNNETINVIKVKRPKFVDIGTEKSILKSSKIAKKIFIQ